jgi:hypothetical protein
VRAAGKRRLLVTPHPVRAREEQTAREQAVRARGQAGIWIVLAPGVFDLAVDPSRADADAVGLQPVQGGCDDAPRQRAAGKEPDAVASAAAAVRAQAHADGVVVRRESAR